jgi:site-specific recombinase XerD
MPSKRPENGLIQIHAPKGGIAIVQPAVEAGKSYLAANTKRAYFKDWMDFFQVDALEKITPAMVLATIPDHVADFRDGCLARGLGAGTVNRKLSSVRAFFDQMILRKVIAINPAHPKLVRSPKRGTVHKMEAMSQIEARAFLSVIDRSTPIGRRDYAVIMTDLHMGLRRSEALSIRAEKFQTSNGKAYIVFRSKGEKERAITINQDLEQALAEYAKDRGNAPGWLFPGRGEKPLSGDQFWRIVQKYLEIAGIKKKIGTHGLRATFITHNIEKGTPLSEIQKTVGHSKGDTTLGYARDLEAIKSRAPAAMEGFKAD